MTQNDYKIRKDGRQKKRDEVEILRAFDKKQREEGLEKHKEIKEAIKNKEKIINIGFGGYTTEKNYNKLKNINELQDLQFKLLAKKDKRLYQAIVYELMNHEYFYNMDFDIFEYLEIEKNEKNIKLYKKAIKEIKEKYER